MESSLISLARCAHPLPLQRLVTISDLLSRSYTQVTHSLKRLAIYLISDSGSLQAPEDEEKFANLMIVVSCALTCHSLTRNSLDDIH